jgi:hypothetical protein
VRSCIECLQRTTTSFSSQSLSVHNASSPAIEGFLRQLAFVS